MEEGRLERPLVRRDAAVAARRRSHLLQAPLLSHEARLPTIRPRSRTSRGGTWRERSSNLMFTKNSSEFETLLLCYPDYYLNPFHAYDDGNLSWLAAAEAEAATMSIAKRAIPEASTVEEANKIVRGNWLTAIEQHHLKYSGTVRLMTFSMSAARSVALFPRCSRVQGEENKEETPSDGSMQMEKLLDCLQNHLTLSLLLMWFSNNLQCHECPARAIIGLVEEAFRLLRPGGTIALTDNSVILTLRFFFLTFTQELSPVLFTLLKSTEPFLDEYYLLDLEETMREAGFVNVNTILTDPRHRTVTATVPL
uniref:Methyltransferase type 11 domain-containing protein n=1 Tax=Ananas comosus var. bracteatus TaxID=296719 RepID=A0A6V7QWM1_ANACO